jgi:hypothetical protein
MVGRFLGRVISPVASPLPTQDNTNMPGVGFEPTIPLFKRAKTFRALDRAAAVIGLILKS